METSPAVEVITEMETFPEMETFSANICFRLELLRALETAGQRVLTYALHCGTSSKPPTVPLDKYLNSLPQSSVAKFNTLSNSQRTDYFSRVDRIQISHDASCSTFDITLLWKAITVACEGWQDPDMGEAESLVKKINDIRNEVVNEVQTDMTEQDFFSKLTELQGILIESLEATKVKYNTDKDKCNEMKVEVKQLVDDIRSEELTQSEILETSVARYLPLLKLEANEELKEKYSSAKFHDPLHFLSSQESRQEDLQVFSSEIAVIKRYLKGDRSKIHHSRLLTVTHDGSKLPTPYLIMVEGVPGSGKTTLLRHIISEYLKDSNCCMEGLDRYDLLLWVVCRKESSSSLENLVERHFPHAYFKYGKLLLTLLSHTKVLILIDGLDEQNDTSSKLVRDILCQGQDCPTFTLLTTSQPEAIHAMKLSTPEKFRQYHLRIKGIPVTERTEVVLRHYRWLCGGESANEAKLQELMEQIGWKNFFRLPFSLLFVATIFYHDPQSLTTTITLTELHQKILDGCVKKLQERLTRHQKVPAGINLQEQIRNFLLESYEIALRGIFLGQIYLSDEALSHLTNFCKKNNLPEEEIIPAFYAFHEEEMNGLTVKQYYAPHRGLQDFFAAKHLLRCINNCKELNKGDLQHILDQSKTDKKLCVEPLRETLYHLLGLLSHQEELKIRVIEETMEFIQHAGDLSMNKWMDTLIDIGAPPDVVKILADFAKQTFIHDKKMHITDERMHIATVLLPLLNGYNIHLDLMKLDTEIEALVPALTNHTVRRFHCLHHYRHPHPDHNSRHILEKISADALTALTHFKGKIESRDVEKLPKNLKYLCLSACDDQQGRYVMTKVRNDIQYLQLRLTGLAIHIPVRALTIEALAPMCYTNLVNISLQLSGVGEEDTDAVMTMVERLIFADKSSNNVCFKFPQATLKFDGWKRLLARMVKLALPQGLKIFVPENSVSEAERLQLTSLHPGFERSTDHYLWW